MERTLRNGAMIWLKRSGIAEVRIGDIVTLSSPESELITHRVIDVESPSQGQYLVETKGNANLPSEHWLIGAKDTVYIVVARITLGGYILEFLDNLYGRALVVCLGITALILMRLW